MTTNSARKPKDEDKEKKFLGRLAYKLDYDFEKSAVSGLTCEHVGKYEKNKNKLEKI